MKRLKNKISGLIFIGFIIFFLMSCVSEPVNIDLPQNHPANPTAHETAFIPPPNPFHNHMKMNSDSDSSRTEKKQSPSHQHQMTHEMDRMNEGSVSKPETGQEKQDHQH